jgi:hypothetical protein
MHTDLKLELSAKNLALGSSPDLYAFQFVHKHVFNKNGGLRVGLLNLRMPPGAISHPPDPGLHGPLSHPTDQGPTGPSLYPAPCENHSLGTAHHSLLRHTISPADVTNAPHSLSLSLHYILLPASSRGPAVAKNRHSLAESL